MKSIPWRTIMFTALTVALIWRVPAVKKIVVGE